MVEAARDDLPGHHLVPLGGSLPYSALTNREARPHLVKAYEGLVSPAFDQHVYTSKDNIRALRWVMERGINLKGFRLELKYSSGDTERESGGVRWLG